MAWGTRQTSTVEKTGVTTEERYTSDRITLEDNEKVHIFVEGGMSGATDDARWKVYASIDGGTTFTSNPIAALRQTHGVSDTNRIGDFIIADVSMLELGCSRIGGTDTFGTATNKAKFSWRIGKK